MYHPSILRRWGWGGVLLSHSRAQLEGSRADLAEDAGPDYARSWATLTVLRLPWL